MFNTCLLLSFQDSLPIWKGWIQNNYLPTFKNSCMFYVSLCGSCWTDVVCKLSFDKICWIKHVQTKCGEPDTWKWGARVLCGLNTASARHDERTASKEVVDRPFDRGEKLICIYTCCQKTYFSRVSDVNIWNSKIAFVWEIGFQQKYIAHWLS